MSTNTVNISFQKEMLKQIDKIAKDESRSRSELIREAARMYIERKRRWEQIFAFGDFQYKKSDIRQSDLDEIIHKHRRVKRKKI